MCLSTSTVCIVLDTVEYDRSLCVGSFKKKNHVWLCARSTQKDGRKFENKNCAFILRFAFTPIASVNNNKVQDVDGHDGKLN